MIAATAAMRPNGLSFILRHTIHAAASESAPAIVLSRAAA
jgi:hypothetical protein